MNRYIDKDLLLQTIDELVYSGIATPEDILDAVKNIIDDIYHTTDAAPVVHGRWLMAHNKIENAVCSACGTHFQRYYDAYSYCQHCGAKMDLEEQNNA